MFNQSIYLYTNHYVLSACVLSELISLSDDAKLLHIPHFNHYPWLTKVKSVTLLLQPPATFSFPTIGQYFTFPPAIPFRACTFPSISLPLPILLRE